MTSLLRMGRSTMFTALLGGCVYYNGMYNANRLAGSARKAEREGRTFQANDLWGQVATKAESVMVRHPTSKYAQEAAVLRGVALARLGHCEEALGPLSAANLRGKSSELTEDAVLATGRCQLALGNIPASEVAFSQLLDSKNREHRREARFQHARLLRQSGRYREALSELEGINDRRADSERVLALAGAGRLPQALALVASLLPKRDSLQSWDSLLVEMGRQEPAAASRLLDRLKPLPARSTEIKASRLLEDGMRLASSDTARARARFQEAVAVGGNADAAGQASVQVVLMDLRRARRTEDLSPAIDTLKHIAGRFETVAYAANQLAAAVASVHDAATSVTWETPRGDLRLFIAAEAARDSLRAPVLAAGLLHRILEDYPNSSYGAKVVLAVQQLDSSWADSARGLLEGLYLDSPYLAMIRGESSDEYRQLEDSLGAYAATLTVKPPAAGLRRRPAVRGELDEPRRRPAAPGTSRVPVQ
jgi:tetratricopeptide (TPR) repeat protein